MYGNQTDPVPYIVAAYGIGIVLLLIYGAVQVKVRTKLRALDQALHSGDSQK